MRQQLWRLVMLAGFAILITLSPRPALAQAAKTASELLSVLKDVPGLSSLPVSDIRKSGDSVSAQVTLHGKSVKVVGFKIDGVPMGAVIPNTFKLTDVAPVPKGTPVDGVSFKDMAFIFVPKGKAKSNISSSKFPDSVRTAVNHFGTHVSLKAGFNLFGQGDFSSSAAIKKVFSALGHNNYTLPLSAAFPTDIFKTDIKSASAKLKKDLMGALNLTLPLPKNLKIHGMPNVVSVKSAQIIVVGREVNGTPTIYAGVTGDLDVNVKGSHKSFSFGMLAAQPGKQFSPKITADSKKGATLTVNLIERMTLTDIAFEATKKNNKWNWIISGDTTIKSKKVTVDYRSSHSLAIKTRLTLAETIDSPGLPGLDDVEFKFVHIYKNMFTMALEAKGVDYDFAAFKVAGFNKHFISLAPTSGWNKSAPINPAKFIPGAEHTPLKDVTFENMAFVYNPGKSSTKLVRSDLPAGLSSAVYHSMTRDSVKPGLNMLGHMKIKPSGEMEKLLKKVGVSTVSMPLNGKFSTKAFSKNISGTAIKNAILDELDLDIKLPTLHVSEVSSFLTFKNGHLKIKGKTPKGVRGIDVAISGDADVHVKHEQVAFAVDVEYDKTGASSDLSFTGKTTHNWTHPLGIKLLDLESLTVSIDKKKKANGTKYFDISMTAKTDIGSHNDIAVSVDVHKKNGKVTSAIFQLTGSLPMSDIPGVKEIPHSSHFTLSTLKVSEHGIEAKIAFGNKSELDAFIFKHTSWNLIVRQDNLALTEFVPPLAHTQLKNIMVLRRFKWI